MFDSKKYNKEYHQKHKHDEAFLKRKKENNRAYFANRSANDSEWREERNRRGRERYHLAKLSSDDPQE